MKEDDMVDLEQFREAVQALRDQFESEAKSISKGNGSAWSLMQARDWRGQADRLLSIIDSSGKVASAGPVACELLAEIRNLLSSLPVDCLGSDTDASGQPYPIRDEVIHDITKTLARSAAPVVDDAMVDAAIAAQDAHWANDDNYPTRAPRSAKGDAELHDKLARGAMRAALTAALAQGVESP